MSNRVEAEVFVECTESGICSPKVVGQNGLVFLAQDAAKILKFERFLFCSVFSLLEGIF